MAAAIGNIPASVAGAVKQVLPGKNPRRSNPTGATVGKRLVVRPDQLRNMQRAAGITPGMSRKRRRELARTFAKQLAQQARATGATASMSRGEARRRQRAFASVVGGQAFP